MKVGERGASEASGGRQPPDVLEDRGWKMEDGRSNEDSDVARTTRGWRGVSASVAPFVVTVFMRSFSLPQ